MTTLHTAEELRIRQGLPLDVKVRMSQQRIREWVEYYGVDGVYISFSGGKDSTALLHLARDLYPDIKAMFVDTGLEYPEIRDFVKTFDNVDIVRPRLSFRQVVERYGYPFISKEISQKVYEHKRQPEGYTRRYFMPEDQGGKRAPYNYYKWRFLLDAPFDVSHKCCYEMKKKPAQTYERKTGRRAKITGQMATESALRTTNWLRHGCNAFESKHPTSNPLSFWTEQDILHYLKENKIKICSVYGDIVTDYSKSEEIAGQLDIIDLGLAEDTRPLTTTGCKRTGCMFCGYGCQLDKDGAGRFERMKKTHPKQYDYIMRPPERGGLNYKNIIDWLNKHGGLNIKY